MIGGTLGSILATLGAALALTIGALGTVVKPKDAPYPGLADDAIEHQTDSVQISDSSTTGTVTINFDAGFTAAPTVSYGYEISAQSGGAASATVDRAEITSKSASSVTVEVELSAAPTSGESTTVSVNATAMGE